MTSASVEIIGSGISGLCCAQQFAARGCHVTLRSASNGADENCCSWWAGGMLAPWCEMESAEPLIGKLGQESMRYWQTRDSQLTQRGSLVVANGRDLPDLQQFASRTTEHQSIAGKELAALETNLDNRFAQGLYFEQESHLDPRVAMQDLQAELMADDQVEFVFNQAVDTTAQAITPNVDWRIDCRGLAARDQLDDLRGVKGEMLLVHCPELTFTRPIRLLHPRYPLYIVPRKNNVYMIGATMLENDNRSEATVRSVMELLSAAYALHPGFAEASILEIGVDARPAFPDNLPRIRRRGRTVYVNGLFRHGFLCAPALATRTAALVLDNNIDEELVDEHTS